MSIIRDVTLAAQRDIDKPDILLFTGARQAGKTTILRQLQRWLEQRGDSTYFFTLEDPDYLRLLNDSPKNLLHLFSFDLNQRSFVFVDEIQYLKNPTHFLKYLYDVHAPSIKILASGSSAFYLDRAFKDSLAGRKKIFSVHTLSFKEFLRFKDEETLSSQDFHHLSVTEAEKIRQLYGEYLIWGGYPRVVLADLAEKKNTLEDLAYSYIKKDMYDAAVKHSDIFYTLFKILASQIGNLVNASELSSTLGVSKTAIENYLYIMQKSFHIHLLRPFHRNIRKELTKMPKIYFQDLGLRNFFAQNFSAWPLRKDKGMLLENAVFRHLLETTSESEIRFWRTIQKHEVDFIVNEKTAWEVKVNPKSFQKAKYDLFFETYPQIQFKIASLGTQPKIVNGIEIWETWQI